MGMVSYGQIVHIAVNVKNIFMWCVLGCVSIVACCGDSEHRNQNCVEALLNVSYTML